MTSRVSANCDLERIVVLQTFKINLLSRDVKRFVVELSHFTPCHASTPPPSPPTIFLDEDSLKNTKETFLWTSND